MAADFRLRPARREDAGVIRALIRSTRLNPMGVNWVNFVLAETASDVAVGIGQLRPHRDGSMELASIAVDKDWRGQGIASSVVEHLIANYNGPLYLTCASPLESFYTPFGFETVPDPKQMPAYFRRVWRLFRLLTSVRADGATLLVMKRG